MSLRCCPSPRLALARACLVLVMLAASRAHGEESPPSPAPAPPPAATAAEAHPVEKPAATPAAAEQPATPADAPAADAATKPEPKKARGEIESLLYLGETLTDRGDYPSAEIAYRQVLNAEKVSETDLKSALLGLAQMHRRQGALTKASAIYERYLKDYPGDERTPDALLELGRTLRGLGVYKHALSRFYNVLNSTLKLPGEGLDRYQLLAKTAQFEIAETHFQAGEFAEANKFYSRLRLLDLAPVDRARAQFKAAYALRLQGDSEGAVTSLRGFIEQWPDDENIPEARYLLAITLREMKRPQEAFAATLELLRTEKSRIAADPKRWAYWQRRTGNQLANDFFETGDTLNARAIYAGLVELSPEPTWRLPITYQLALCYERLGIYDRARTAYQSILDTAGPEPSPDFAELATMSKWRIEHLEWRDKVTQQISSFFDSTTGKQAAVEPTASQKKTAATP